MEKNAEVSCAWRTASEILENADLRFLQNAQKTHLWIISRENRQQLQAVTQLFRQVDAGLAS